MRAEVLPNTTNSEVALDLIHDCSTVGLGTGRAATLFVRALGERVKSGLRVKGLPTSLATARLAHQLGIPLIDFDDATTTLDLTVDGADEVDPRGDLIKGWGGSLVREKIVAAASRRLVILVGAEKVVSQLGARGKLPVEVVPFGMAFCRARLAALGLPAQPRRRAGVNDGGNVADGAGGDLFVSDNGNHILDCETQLLADPAALESELLSIPGVVGTGLFLNMADTIIVERGADAQMLRRA